MVFRLLWLILVASVLSISSAQDLLQRSDEELSDFRHGWLDRPQWNKNIQSENNEFGNSKRNVQLYPRKKNLYNFLFRRNYQPELFRKRFGSFYPNSKSFGTKSFTGESVGSEFLGKRGGLGSEFLGKRAMGSEFLGKRAMGSEFLGKRAMGSELLGKRAMGSEFLGKRAMGSEFLGKRAMGSELLGKRAMGSELLGKRAMGSEFLGKRAMGYEFLGKRASELDNFESNYDDVDPRYQSLLTHNADPES